MEWVENKKPLLITLAVLTLIIAATVAVTLLTRGRGGTRYSGSGNAPYPYSWVEKDNGTIALSLETGDAPDAVWSIAGTEGDAVDCEVGTAKGGTTPVTLTPEEAGLEMLRFSLVRGEEEIAELRVSVEVEARGEGNPRLVATVTDHAERALQGAVRGGEETGHAFTVRSDSEGLTIFVEETEGYTDDGTAWTSESTDTMTAYVSEIDVSDEGVTVRLKARANGTARVSVANAAEELAFVFDVEVKGGTMLLTGSAVEPYAAEEPEDEAEESAPEAEESAAEAEEGAPEAEEGESAPEAEEAEAAEAAEGESEAQQP